MKLVKSLLLGSAAGLLAVASAQAADLPYKKAAPVEYVKICDAHGAGFFYIPGTDTCLKVGGDVEFYYSFVANKKTFAGYSVVAGHGVLGATNSSKLTNSDGVKARGRVQLDARNTTAWGTLRTFVSVQVDHTTGIEKGTATPGSSTDAASVDKAYIQFAGFTAGRYQSVFDFYADDWNHWDLDDSDTSVNGLAYTATFGGGFSATLSVEDRADRLGNYYNGSGNGLAINTTGDQVPDIVGQVNWSQGWGQVQLSAAAHEESSFLTAVAGTGTSLASKSTWGYAIQGGVEINLPTLAAGDQLWLEGAYTDGALAYQQVNSTRGTSYIQTFNGGVIQTDYDAIWLSNGAGGYTIKSPTSWSVMAAFQHYFTPTIIGRLTGSYIQVDYSSTAALAALTSSWNRIKVGPQLVWMPVAGFQVGVETLYIRQEDKFPIAVAGAKKDEDGYQATIHIERDF
jgi:hypothetical protein